MDKELARDKKMYNLTDRLYNIELDNTREARAKDIKKKSIEKKDWAKL